MYTETFPKTTQFIREYRHGQDNNIFTNSTPDLYKLHWIAKEYVVTYAIRMFYIMDTSRLNIPTKIQKKYL